MGIKDHVHIPDQVLDADRLLINDFIGAQFPRVALAGLPCRADDTGALGMRKLHGAVVYRFLGVGPLPGKLTLLGCGRAPEL